MTTDWKQLSVAEIEQRYDQGVYAANAREVNQWYTQQSKNVLAALHGERFAYGLSASDYGYWFKAGTPGRPVVVFIHGGAWRIGTAEDYLFPARWLTQQLDVNYVCLNFDNAPATGGRIFPMLDQLMQGVSWVSRNMAKYQAAPEMHLVSHSSGSHLAACLAGLDWATLLPHAPGLMKSVLLCSGIYDLEPVGYSKRREYLELSAAEVFALSPLRHSVNRSLRFVVLRGELESPEFIRQHDAYVTKLQREGVALQEGVGLGLNHFEILQTFGDAGGYMAQAFRRLVEGSSNAKKG